MGPVGHILRAPTSGFEYDLEGPAPPRHRCQRFDKNAREDHKADEKQMWPEADFTNKIERRKTKQSCKEPMPTAELRRNPLDDAEGAVFKRKVTDLLNIEAAVLCQARECCRIEVPSMSGDVEMQPVFSEKLRLEGTYVRDGDDDHSVGFDETTRFD